ncbi:pyridoxine 5'-phosphate oxidase C-terminal domain-containing protein [Paenibacillus solani]|uniref:pyridoxine 5'-phosphate oxidase C-terminal domain-containing protein n=1 Tax=Paenibacillus solani TaxID=1705565 RepID=UPI003D2893BF
MNLLRILNLSHLLGPLYQVTAREVEFWQANEDRKHTRLQYKLDCDRWTKNILWP